MICIFSCYEGITHEIWNSTLEWKVIDMSSSMFLNVIYFDPCVTSVHIANSLFPQKRKHCLTILLEHWVIPPLSILLNIHRPSLYQKLCQSNSSIPTVWGGAKTPVHSRHVIYSDSYEGNPTNLTFTIRHYLSSGKAQPTVHGWPQVIGTPAGPIRSLKTVTSLLRFQ